MEDGLGDPGNTTADDDEQELANAGGCHPLVCQWQRRGSAITARWTHAGTRWRKAGYGGVTNEEGVVGGWEKWFSHSDKLT